MGIAGRLLDRVNTPLVTHH